MKIIAKEVLVDYAGVRIVRLVLSALEISQKVRAGEFVVVMSCKNGERIPLTVVCADPQSGTITLIFQEAGLTTKTLGSLNAGDSLYALLGPLGHPTLIKNYGKVILVGGGVGIAEILPVAKALKAAGNNLTTILGAKTKALLILEKELQSFSSVLEVLTDDGSSGEKGFTTVALEKHLKENQYDLVYAVGPLPMMKKVAEISKNFKAPVIVSLNALMVDATGMCGCCRVTVDGKIKFSCVDGPEFDASKIDWEELSRRNTMYAKKEQHICKLGF